jgi:hypothetical protein
MGVATVGVLAAIFALPIGAGAQTADPPPPGG